MKKLLAVLSLLALLTGCATPTYTPSYDSSATDSTSIGTLPKECTYVERHVTSTGETVPASYQCVGSNVASYVGGNCSWVPTYYRQDGTPVAGHTRCLNRPTIYAPTYTPSGGSGGPVNVRGYYRKDGTYVSPHTRSRPGSRRR